MGAAFRINRLSIKAHESGDAHGHAGNVRPEVNLRVDERAGQKSSIDIQTDFDKSLQVLSPSCPCCFPHFYWCGIQ
jgi:hypothetical protein